MSESPQQRRLKRLEKEGLNQRNVIVLHSNQLSFDFMRRLFAHPGMVETLSEAAQTLSVKKPVNVSRVRQLSPFRYSGGKTWLLPVIREWCQSFETRPKLLLESFAGGAIVGLTAAAEGWAEHVRLVELDDDMAAVWNLTLHGSDQDFQKFLSSITTLEFTTENVREIIDASPRAIHKKALRTLVKNRAQRGGIMAPGAGLMKGGENGKGIASRWYPDTLAKRLKATRSIKERLTFVQAAAISEIEQHQDKEIAHFVDPPYTAGGKKAGRRLYKHNELDHELLLETVQNCHGPAMLTYDDNEWIREQAENRGFDLATSTMQSTHLVTMHELVIIKEQS